MDIENITGKLLTSISRYGSLIGGGLAIADPNTLNATIESIQYITQGKLHAPELQNILNEVKTSTNFQTAIAAAVAGYLLKDATDNQTVKKASELAQKAGTAYAAVWLLSRGLYYSTHSPMIASNNSTAASPSAIGDRGYS